MSSSEKFCLKWNDFEANISLAFRELRDDKDFFDITLVCDDEQVEAHKVVLSACSPFFRSLLRRNRHQHPLLLLRGVALPELLAVLTFMYHGEVNVAQEELNSFLALAEELQVKGLTQGPGKEGKQARSQEASSRKRSRVWPSPTVPAPTEFKEVVQRQEVEEVQEDDVRREVEEVAVVKAEPVVAGAGALVEADTEEVGGNYEEYDTFQYGAADLGDYKGNLVRNIHKLLK